MNVRKVLYLLVASLTFTIGTLAAWLTVCPVASNSPADPIGATPPTTEQFLTNQSFKIKKQLMPLDKGTVWVYKGKLKWQEGGAVKAAEITWATEVIDTFDSESVRVAIVRGFPFDLSWHLEGQQPDYCVLADDGSDAYYRYAATESDARRMVYQTLRNPSEGLMWFESIDPNGIKLGATIPFQVDGCPECGALRYSTMVHETNPDTEKIDFAPGLGVIRYRYTHHGSISDVDVRLFEIRRP
jgi:hypothetical protein